MKRILLLISALVLVNFGVVAQEFDYGDSPGLHLDVNGLFGDEKYSDKTIKEKLGEPTELRIFKNAKYGTVSCYEYRYGESPADFDYFSHNDVDGFHRFEISTPRFKLFQGQLEVGDRFSKLSEVTSGYVERVGVDLYRYWANEECVGLPLEITVDNSSKISKFSRGVTAIKF